MRPTQRMNLPSLDTVRRITKFYLIMLGPTSFWKLFGEICSCCQDVLTVLFTLVHFAAP